MPTSELRRSGRVKSKSSVVEENTASDAYSVDDESSGDDFVDGNGKGIEVGNRVVKRGSGSNVSHSRDDKGKKVIESNSGAVKKRKKSDIIGDDKEKGESSKATTSKPKKEKGKIHTYLLDFKVDGIPSKLGFYVANNFNADTMKIKLKDTSIGRGKGELQGRFVEEDDPMPEDEDGFMWKLNTYVENIRKERDGFERTFVAASNVLRGNQFLADVYQQYRTSLHYKNVGNEGNSGSYLNGDNNDEPQQVNTLQEAVDNNSKDYDSLMFALGPATQKEVFTRVDKVVKEFESSKKGNDFEAPSFSFGVTQDFEMETPVTDRNTPVLGSANQLELIKAVPVSMCKPVLKDEDVVHGRGKRKYTKLQAARSPFMLRVTDISATESKDEKRVEKFLLNKIGIDQSAVLSENETGTKASRKQMESLANGENIDNAVVDAWSKYLKSLENLRGENSMSRFFLPTFIVMFGIESKANTSITNFLMDVETVNERAGRKNMINLVDLQKRFCNYRARLNPNKVAAVLRVEVTREDFYWQTDKRPNDSGVFLMRHMEAYMGTIISKWACGMETEGRKQNTLLGHLRKRYAATLLLSKCNMHSDNVRAQLEGIE
ncbi:hypothetical protein Tco_0887991 [Tanacetum coccineum]